MKKPRKTKQSQGKGDGGDATRKRRIRDTALGGVRKVETVLTLSDLRGG